MEFLNSLINHIEFSIETVGWSLEEIDRLRAEHKRQMVEDQRKWKELLRSIEDNSNER